MWVGEPKAALSHFDGYNAGHRIGVEIFQEGFDHIFGELCMCNKMTHLGTPSNNRLQHRR